MHYRFWTLAFVILTFVGTLGMGVGNYLLDPFGLRSIEGKNLMTISKKLDSYIYKPKILQKAPYYVSGSSRTFNLNAQKLTHYLKSHVIFVDITSQSLDENLFLLQALKHNGSNFISGFDAFALSTARKDKNRFSEPFTQDNLTAYITLLIHPYTTRASVALLIKDMLLHAPHDRGLTLENERAGERNTHEEIEEYRFKRLHSDMQSGALYEHYNINESKILKLAHLGDSQDIFIIFPKYAYYYELFARYEVQEPYFKAIEILVSNTKARVLSFYGNNSITCNKDNFDDYAWHFKPKVGDLILARIFDDGTKSLPEDFGVELTKENIHSYLQSLRKQIRSNPCKSTESKITESK